MGDYSKITDFESRALARQIEFFKDKVNFNRLITIISEEVQRQEDTISDFHEFRSLSTAFGVQLDFLGEILNVTRGTDTDTLYRSRLQTAIQALNKGGQIEALITAYKALLPSHQVLLEEYFPATVIMWALVDSLSISDASVINDAMQGVRAGGIELAVGAALNTGSFTLASAPGQYSATEGLSSDSIGTDGGQLATLLY